MMRKHYLFLCAYFCVMGIGLLICNQVLNTPYDDENFSERFLPFMTILAVMVMVYCHYHKSSLVLASMHKRTYIYSLLPLISIVLLAIIATFNNWNGMQSLLLPLIDALFIGIAEEGLFRGVILGSLLKKVHLIKAILLSSLLFASIHILNIFGGLTIDEVWSQLLSTLVMGIFLGTVYAYTHNIYIPIIFHSTWDYIFIVQGMDAPFAPVLLITTVILEVIVTCIMLWHLKASYKKQPFDREPDLFNI